MKKFHPVVAVILANIVTSILLYYLPNVVSLDITIIIQIFIIMVGGFIATYLSKTNKAIFGLYNGLLYWLGWFLTTISSSAVNLSMFMAIFLLSTIPAFIGGYFARLLRSRFENKNEE